MKLWINKCKAKKMHATICLISLSLVFMIFSCDTDTVSVMHFKKSDAVVRHPVIVLRFFKQVWHLQGG